MTKYIFDFKEAQGAKIDNRERWQRTTCPSTLKVQYLTPAMINKEGLIFPSYQSWHNKSHKINLFTRISHSQLANTITKIINMKIFVLLSNVWSDLIGYYRLANNVHHHKIHSGSRITQNHARSYNVIAKIADFLAEKEELTIHRSILRDLLEHQKSTSHTRRHRLNSRFLTFMKMSKGT